MKKTYKNLIKILIFTIFLALPSMAFAEDFKSIDIDVNIDQSGVGHVREIWHIDEKGVDYTERYKRIENLKDLKIENFKLNNNGVDFTRLDPWDINKSFDEKKGYYGIIEDGEDIELSWGISQKEDNTYILTYDIKPIIIGLNDYDMLNFRFVGDNFDPMPDKITMTIRSYEPLTTDNVSMWGFGFEGDIHAVDGKILAKSTGDVNYGQVMLRFPIGTFDTSYREDKEFIEYATEALEGSKWEETEGDVDPKSNIVGKIVGITIAFGAIIFGIVAMVLAINASLDYKFTNKKALTKARKFKGQYYRDIPYDGPFEDTFIIANHAFETENNIENYLNAFLLKWIADGSISFKENPNGKKVKAKDGNIKINHEPTNMSEVERGFFDIISSAGIYSKDGYISQKNIRKYMEEDKDQTKDYFRALAQNSADNLTDRGYIENEKKLKDKKDKIYKNKMTILPEGINLYENFIKFKNYLKDYSLIAERNVNEVKLWDDFMVYAAIYGISKEVYKNFIDMYPEYENISIYNYYMINNIHSYSSGISNSYASMAGFEAAGVGGSTSVGGGGGGFGGGGGGGR